MKKLSTLIIYLFFVLQAGYAATYYVSVSGNDSGDGSAGNPWRTLRTAVSKVPANQGHTIKLLGGTFVETGFINVPTGVNIEGSGIGVTILKASPSMYFKSYAWSFDKFLLILQGGGAGNQSVKNLTIDGDNKQLYGGIIVNGRNNVLIESVRVQYTYYTGIWIWETLDCRLTRLQLKDCAWGGAGGASGSVKISRSERLEIDHCDFDEAHGQALDAVGSGKMYDLKVHDNRFSVSPVGNWQTPGGVTVPNLAVEFYEVTLRGCQVYNNYFDNTFSVVMAEPQFEIPTGVQTIRVYNNTFDLVTRANGSGSGMELIVHDAEVDHNYFHGGSTAIANWDASPDPSTMHNWKIHHNQFYAIASYYPTAIVNLYRNGISNAHIYNNTVETTGNSTVHFIEVNNAGVARNVRIENNLIIDSNSSYRWYPNQFISLVNGATMQGSTVRNNFVQKMTIGSVAGATYSGNLSGNAGINASGNRPKPYYELTSGSPLIDKGVNVGHQFSGNGPDIGAFEFGGTAEPRPNEVPSVALTSPADGASAKLGTTVTISAEASDQDGSVSKVQFFQGSTLLGEDSSSPYSFAWKTSATGQFVLTAKVIDNESAAKTSSPINFTVTSSTPPTVSITSPADNTSLDAGTSVTITANAADADGSITKVEFYNGSTKLGEDQTSPYTYAWANVIAGTHQLTAKATDNIGNTAVSSVITLNVSAQNIPPTIAITEPADNRNFVTGSTITITVFATDKDGQITKVEFFNGTTKLGEDTSSPHSFAWNNVAPGTYLLTTKAYDNKGASGLSTPITVIVSDANKAPTVSITSPVNNATFAPGSAISITSNAVDPDGTISKVEFFAGSTKLGEVADAPYSLTWTNVTAGTHKLTAKAFDNAGATNISDAITINVGYGNLVPTVDITSPGDNSTFDAGSDITFEVFAMDTDGEITKVEFYNGDVKLGEDTSSPYNFTWTSAPAGTHQLTARIFDDAGASGTSAPLMISVNSPNLPPTVEFTTPVNNASFNEGTDIAFNVSASDKDGQITKVEFYNGAVKLGEDTSSPYSFSWSNAPAGTHQLTAKTFDNAGASTTSAKLTITVNSTNISPTVEFTTPSNNVSFNEGSEIFLQVFATDKDGQITKVEFYNGTVKLGEDTSSPHNFVWTNAPAGTHQLTAKTFDNKGASGTSAPLTITVNGMNIRPTVEFTTPSNNASFNEGSDIAFQVSASDKDGQITKVEFYNGTVRLGEDTSSPYNFSWSNAPTGIHQLTAKAFDNKGASGTSAPLTITVNGTNILPTVEYTTPVNNASFNEGSDIFFQVFATDKDGQITKVEFYNGTVKLGEDTSSPHNFIWSNAPAGIHQLTAKTFDNKGASGTSAPLTITVNSTNIRPTADFTTPVNNASFNEGSDIAFEVSATDKDGKVTKVEFYNGMVRLGEDASSPYNLIWSNAPAGIHQLTAKAFDNAGASGTSAPLTITVNSTNLRPTVEFTTPVNNASFAEGSNIFFQVFATDKDGQITKVEFYNGTVKLGEDTSSPHNFDWANAPAGIHQLTAKTFDNKGASGTSRPLTISVNSTNLLPTVEFTTPVNNASFDEGSDIFFQVFATDKDGQITKVEFYNGDVKLGEDTSSPHNFVWTNAPAGIHQITAKTFDNKGASGTSGPLTISVNSTNLLPTVEFTTPVNNASFDEGSDIFFQVFATDKDGQITKVEFYNGDVKLGEDTSSPHNFVWTIAPAGTYQLTAKAFDNKGASGMSLPLTVLITPTDSGSPIPRFFTPNNDGINDLWLWPQTHQSSCHVKVYDQSGKAAFESDAYKNDWDGTAGGSQLPEGVYLYVAECGNVKITGAVRIIR